MVSKKKCVQEGGEEGEGREGKRGKSAARAHQPPRTQLSAAGSEAQDTGNFSGKPSVQIRSKFSCLEDRKGQYKKDKKTDNTNTWDVVMSVWECLRSRREQKWVGGHRCRGSALSRLSPRSPRRARAGHIVPKQRRAAAYLHSLRSVEEPLGRLRFLVGSCGIADLWSPNLKDSPPPSPGTFLIVTS